MTEEPPSDDGAGTPRWVRVLVIVSVVLLLLVVVAVLVGGHGPGIHAP